MAPLGKVGRLWTPYPYPCGGTAADPRPLPPYPKTGAGPLLVPVQYSTDPPNLPDIFLPLHALWWDELRGMTACLATPGCCTRHPKACVTAKLQQPLHSLSAAATTANRSRHSEFAAAEQSVVPPPCPSHNSSRPSAAILFAGPPTHRHAPGVDYANHVRDRLVQPLLAGGFTVGSFATADSEADVEGWRRFLAPVASAGASPVEVALTPPAPDRERTRFADSECRHKHHKSSEPCVHAWQVWSHLDATFQLLRRYEVREPHRRPFDFLVKARNDVAYRPSDALDPSWLLQLPTDVLAVPSVELHMSDRWLERAEASRRWPSILNDQLAFGSRAAMGVYFGLVHSHSRSGFKPYHHEQILAEYLLHARAPPLRIVTVELQYSQPGGKFVNGKNGEWVRTPCRFCWRPAEGGAALGGVGDKLEPVLPCFTSRASSEQDQ